MILSTYLDNFRHLFMPLKFLIGQSLVQASLSIDILRLLGQLLHLDKILLNFDMGFLGLPLTADNEGLDKEHNRYSKQCDSN